jgi:UDP-N-acetylmuramate dehydrogenase
MQLHKDFDLRPLNTFGISVKCKYLIEIEEETELPRAVEMATHFGYPFMVLGGGSNMLFTEDYEGSILYMRIPGISAETQGEEVLVTAGAGVVWHDLVQYAVAHGYGGLENLALIPGTVGASPIQNIGAYGVEVQDVFDSLRGYHLEQGFMEFDKKSCHFGYRQSIFKGALKGKFIVTQVRFRLSTQPNLKLHYGALQDALAQRGLVKPSIAEVAEVVSSVRVSKLPDPSSIGNAGSFFKNPEIPEAQFQRLKIDFPEMVGYPAGEGVIKASAAWLIESCGWKGKVIGNTGTYAKHALVLVNHGHATGSDIWALAQSIQRSVQECYGIHLEPEVNIIGRVQLSN